MQFNAQNAFPLISAAACAGLGALGTNFPLPPVGLSVGLVIGGIPAPFTPVIPGMLILGILILGNLSVGLGIGGIPAPFTPVIPVIGLIEGINAGILSVGLVIGGIPAPFTPVIPPIGFT